MKLLSKLAVSVGILGSLFFVASIQFTHAADCSLSGTGTWSTNSANLGESVVAKFPEQNCNGRAIILQFFGKSGETTFHIKDLNYTGQIPAIGEGYVTFSASDFQGKTGDIQVYFIPKTSNGSATGSSSQLLTVSQTNNGSSATGVLDLHFDAMPGTNPKVLPADKKIPVVLSLTLDTTQFGQYCEDINTTSFRWSIYESYPGTISPDLMVYPENFINPLGQLESFVRSSTPISRTFNPTVTATVTGQSTTGFYAIIECGSINNAGIHKNASRSDPVLFNVGTGQLRWSCIAPSGTGGYTYACSDANLPDCSDVKDVTTGRSLCTPSDCKQIGSSLCGSAAPAPGGGGTSPSCGGAGQPACPPGGTGTCGGTGQPACPPISDTIPQNYSFNITNPLAGGPNNLFDIIDIVTKWIMYISIPLAVLWIMWAGFLMLTAGSKPENFQKGMGILKYAVLGLAIIFIGKGFVSLIISVIELGGTPPPTSQPPPGGVLPPAPIPPAPIPPGTMVYGCLQGFCVGNADPSVYNTFTQISANPACVNTSCANTATNGSLPGSSCGNSAPCLSGMTCKNSICQRGTGNFVNEPCARNNNCRDRATCDLTKPQTIDGQVRGTCIAPAN